ncbi:MAG: hypothetical protein MN733_32560, partial [Nitrososphaera sp.]|nr:hypothetical protein [Nitrososphaera sp.]
AHKAILSKNVLGMFINLIAAHRNKWPTDTTATQLHHLCHVAWEAGSWFPNPIPASLIPTTSIHEVKE